MAIFSLFQIPCCALDTAFSLFRKAAYVRIRFGK